jgi:hypothetical protein
VGGERLFPAGDALLALGLLPLLLLPPGPLKATPPASPDVTNREGPDPVRGRKEEDAVGGAGGGLRSLLGGPGGAGGLEGRISPCRLRPPGREATMICYDVMRVDWTRLDSTRRDSTRRVCMWLTNRR